MDKLAHSPEESAQILGICRTKIFQEIRAGRLRARKVGKRTILLADDLREYARNLPVREFDGGRR